MIQKYINKLLNFITNNSYNRYLIYFLTTNFVIYSSTLTNDLAIIKFSILFCFLLAFIGTLFFIKHISDVWITNIYIQNFLLILSISLIGFLFLLNVYLSYLFINNLETQEMIYDKNSQSYTHTHKTKHKHLPNGTVVDSHNHKGEEQEGLADININYTSLFSHFYSYLLQTASLFYYLLHNLNPFF